MHRTPQEGAGRWKPPDEGCMRAFELHIDGWGDLEIAKQLHDWGYDIVVDDRWSASRWRKRGEELHLEANKDEMGRKAARYRQHARINARYRELHARAQLMADDAHFIAAYKELFGVEDRWAKLHGTDARPPATRVDVKGVGVQPDPKVFETLAAAAKRFEEEEGSP